ncbi:hypothetical protein FOXYSP1_05769 [Fusarium oxysporum f. sp. phaseoli]
MVFSESLPLPIMPRPGERHKVLRHIFDPATHPSCRLSALPLIMQASAQHVRVHVSFLHMTSMVLYSCWHRQLSQINSLSTLR